VVVEKVVVEEEKVAAVVEKGPNIEARPRAVLSNAIILAQILGKGQGSRFFSTGPQHRPVFAKKQRHRKNVSSPRRWRCPIPRPQCTLSAETTGKPV
jgi:hypothetical protein